MASHSILERIATGLAFLSVAVVVCGTKACREDYDLGSQTTNPGTATATPTTEDDGTVSGTRTATPTATPGGVAETTATATPVATAETNPTKRPAAAVDGTSAESGLLQELSSIGEGSANDRAAAASGNWLGKSFSKDQQDGSAAAKGGWVDADGDGFSDATENTAGTDPLDPTDLPASLVTTNLDDRVRVLDRDVDGLVVADELKFGTDPGSLDTDADGRMDGMEVLSGGDPLHGDDRYLDADGDGLGDEYERTNGTNPKALDSDGDGLRDDIEVVVGSNPLKFDTDSDGISDGKEYDLGSDPTVAESKS